MLLTLGEGLEPRAEFEFAGKALTSRWIDVSTLEIPDKKLKGAQSTTKTDLSPRVSFLPPMRLRTEP